MTELILDLPGSPQLHIYILQSPKSVSEWCLVSITTLVIDSVNRCKPG